MIFSWNVCSLFFQVMAAGQGHDLFLIMAVDFLSLSLRIMLLLILCPG